MLRKLLAAAVLAFVSGAALAYTGTNPQWGPYGWQEGDKIGVLTTNPQARTVIFINSYYPEWTPEPGQWQTIDWTQFGVPADAKSVFLGGILIITHGLANQDCNLTVTFNAPSESDPASYIFQTIEAQNEGGQRSTAGAWVPIKDGKTKWQWGRGNSPGQWPAGPVQIWPAECSYGVNLSAQAYVR